MVQARAGRLNKDFISLLCFFFFLFFSIHGSPTKLLLNPQFFFNPRQRHYDLLNQQKGLKSKGCSQQPGRKIWNLILYLHLVNGILLITEAFCHKFKHQEQSLSGSSFFGPKGKNGEKHMIWKRKTLGQVGRRVQRIHSHSNTLVFRWNLCVERGAMIRQVKKNLARHKNWLHLTFLLQDLLMPRARNLYHFDVTLTLSLPMSSLDFYSWIVTLLDQTLITGKRDIVLKIILEIRIHMKPVLVSK